MSGLNDCNIILVENIPYDTSETKLKEIFQQVGPIVSFRLVFDKENKRSTGYCYCEYHDPATSASAIRNLNNVEMEGQKLKVGYADYKSSSVTNEVYRLNPSFKSSAQQLSQQQQKLLQQSSQSSDSSDNDKSECSSSSRSSGMNEEQLLDVLLTLQLYSQSTNENQARELLLQNPLLAYDLFRILFQLDLVDENILKKLVSEKQPERTSNTTVPINMNCQDLSPEIYQQQQIQQYQLSQPQQILQQQYQQYSQQSQQYQQVQLQHQNMFTPSPNVITQPIQQPIQPIQPLPVGTNLNNPYVGELQIQEQNAALILQLLNLTPQQIEMFPPDQRNRILALQQQIFLHARRI